ncbi:histidine kinase N-terminal 7TM domain-containing protein [Halorientalis brevis]|uniref:Histidine kinase N-terminal 7TM domain-containing protein n=1 Tax=Halorientalis brevis TaxID=1126241 RepID=A0ABD6CHE3_9EURY|nr:histidine kinase N-terminal 7TM domain-containing protein [Halorientalis brevis]
MALAFNVYTVPLFVAAAISLVLLLVTLPQRGRPGAWPMIGFLGAIVVWTVSYGLMLGTGSPVQRLFWHNLRFVGPTLTTLAIFVFALEYTGRSELVTTRHVLLLAVVPILTNLLVWTNQFHHLVRATTTVVEPAGNVVRLAFTWGPWYYLHVVYSYLLAIGSMALFVEKFLRLGESTTAVKQARTMFYATIAPLFGNLVYLLGITEVDFAPFGFTLSAVLIVTAIAIYS